MSISSPCDTRFFADLRCVLALLSVFVPFATPSLAQEKKDNLADLSLQDLMAIQVYTASKHLRRAGDAPSSVTVIIADQIKRYMSGKDCQLKRSMQHCVGSRSEEGYV
jgi:hypothetical protein